MNFYTLSEIMTLKDLQEYLEQVPTGLLFCFGTSMISKIIQAKTRKTDTEQVPSHVAMISYNHIYESTTDVVHIDHKKIKSGVRRWLLKDFLKAEYKKQTRYAVLTTSYLDDELADHYIHLPYGKDIILDFLLKDGSEGDSNGLICSQYANIVTQLLPKKKCPNPAELYREAIRLTGGQE